MNTSARTVLSLTSSEAIDFFMKSEQYHGFELLEYFMFDSIFTILAHQLLFVTKNNL